VVFLFPSIQNSICFHLVNTTLHQCLLLATHWHPVEKNLSLCFPERVVGGVCNEGSMEPVLFLTTSSVNLHQSNANERAAAIAAEIGKIKITPLCLLCAASGGAGCAPHE
jgi:hypothetical protein